MEIKPTRFKDGTCSVICDGEVWRFDNFSAAIEKMEELRGERSGRESAVKSGQAV